MQAIFENFRVSDSDSDDDSDLLGSRNDYGGQSSSNQWDTLSSRSSVTWKQVSGTTNKGFSEILQLKLYFQKDQGQHHILKEASNLIVQSVDFVYLLMSLCSALILKFTIKHGQANDANFLIELWKLEKFIGPPKARGVLVGINSPIHQSWSREWGQPIFANTISTDRFKELMKHLRFDNLSTRPEKRQADKLCLISEIWNDFIENC